MTVYKKLQEARLRLVNTQLTKSGKNKFAGFEYFELGDFIPQVHKIFNEVGLCGVVSFADVAVLTVYDTDDSTLVSFQTPIVNVENAKGQAIQSLGATHTYLRRYLWLLALEIVEHDAVDAVEQVEPKVKAKPVEKPVADLTPVDVPVPPREIVVPDGHYDEAATVDWIVSFVDEWVAGIADITELRDFWKVNKSILSRVEKFSKPVYKAMEDNFKARAVQLKEAK